MKYVLEPHQAKAVEEMHNGCILVGDVGTGKSFTLVKYYEKNEAPRDVYVITTARKRNDLDWEEEFLQIGVGPARDATLSGVLTVDSWNNIAKYENVKDAFFVFDEQRVVGSGAWTKSFYKIARANRWVLLSATPGDTWMDYIPVFVANGFYKNKTEFVREHVVFARWSKFPKVERYLASGRLVRHRNALLVKMPMARHTTRKLTWTETAYDTELMDLIQKKRWNVFESKPLKDVAELFRVSRKLVNSDGSRLSSVRSLMEKHPRLIVFYNFDYELEMLRTLADPSPKCGTSSTSSVESERQPSSSEESNSIVQPGGSTSGQTSAKTTSSAEPTELVVAEWNGHKHEPVPTSERWLYLVQYQAGSEGWNCVTTDAMAFWSLTYSYKSWHQAFGRIDRMNTRFTELHYYALASKSWIDLAIRKSLSAKKNFNESSFGVKF